MREGVPQVPPDIPLTAAAQIMQDQGVRALFLMHHAGGIEYPAAMLSLTTHLLRHLAAKDDDELRDLGIHADRAGAAGTFYPETGRGAPGKPGRRDPETSHNHHLLNHDRSESMPIEIPKDKWPGTSARSPWARPPPRAARGPSTVTVGGEKAMPFMHFEGAMPNRPVVAVEIKDRRPEDWSPLAAGGLGRGDGRSGQLGQSCRSAGADLIQLSLSLTDADGKPITRRRRGSHRSKPCWQPAGCR